MCVGTAAAQKAAKLTENSRIKIGDCDVTTKYEESKRITYTNYKIFSFEDASAGTTLGGGEPEKSVDDGEVNEDGGRFPF